VFRVVGALLLLSTSVQAASITTSQFPNGTLISLTGDIAREDYLRFQSAIAPIEGNGLVLLNSEGGNAVASFAIGAMIRDKGYNTIVYDMCSSGCAAIWLAGKTRYLGVGAHVGFHGAYDPQTGQTGSSVNALYGYYLAHLGFEPDAITFFPVAVRNS
jgi:ATP-dependent protease ClpP protease subunit